MKTIEQYLIEAGISESDVGQFSEAYKWEASLVRKLVADYEDPAVAARRAKWSSPGVERGAKLYHARKAFLADLPTCRAEESEMSTQTIYECVYRPEAKTYAVRADGETIGQFELRDTGFYRNVCVWRDLPPTLTVAGSFAQIVTAFEDSLEAEQEAIL
jgi:hypothetical protein